MSTPASLIRTLKKLLEKECDLYERYISLLEEERGSVTEFNTTKLELRNQKRKQLTDQMEEFHLQRLKVMSELPDGEQRKLTDIINDESAPKDLKALRPLVERLRELVMATREEATEFQMVQNFAMKIVNGSLALFAQASKHVSKQYGRNGAVNESYVPKRSRKEDVIKEA